MAGKFGEILTFLGNQDLMRYATDKRLLVALALVFLIAVIMRWKWVLVLLLMLGGSMGLIRYINFEPVSGGVDPTLITFVVGCLIIALGIIYLLFIKSD